MQPLQQAGIGDSSLCFVISFMVEVYCTVFCLLDLDIGLCAALWSRISTNTHHTHTSMHSHARTCVLTHGCAHSCTHCCACQAQACAHVRTQKHFSKKKILTKRNPNWRRSGWSLLNGTKPVTQL